MATYKKLSDNYLKLLDQFHSYLLENQEKILNDLPWDLGVVRELRIGYDQKRQCLVFPIYDEEWELINIYWHKGINFPPKMVKGAPSKLLYPLPLIVNYPKDDYLDYLEGLKDAVTMLSKGFNIATHIGSASNIPDDLSLIMTFDRLFAFFDNDEAGRMATDKLGLRLLGVY